MRANIPSLLDAITIIGEQLEAEEARRAEIVELLTIGENSMLSELAMMFRVVSADAGTATSQWRAAHPNRSRAPGTRN